MGVQKFVQGQEDRNEIKRRANQYDQALGALQSGQELPQGIAPSVGLKAKDTWNSFQDNELSSKANKEAYTFSHGVKESANQILTRFSEISKQQGYDAGMDFLNKIPQSNLQQSQALALAHENLKRNRDFNIKRFDDAKRVAQEEGGKINQGLTHASNLYTMGDTTRAMDALTSVIQESRLPYTVKKDGDRYDIFHTNEQGESIKVKDDLKFEDVALAVKQAVPQLALSIAEQRSRVSDANAKNILSGGQIMQDTQTGKNVRVIQTVPKDGNLGGPVISIYDDDTGQLVQQATDPKQLKGRYRQPRQVETRQYVTPEGRVFTGTPEQARGLKARPVDDVKVERDLAGGGYGASNADITSARKIAEQILPPPNSNSPMPEPDVAKPIRDMMADVLVSFPPQSRMAVARAIPQDVNANLAALQQQYLENVQPEGGTISQEINEQLMAAAIDATGSAYRKLASGGRGRTYQQAQGGYGLRQDGTPKESGYTGELQRPSGNTRKSPFAGEDEPRGLQGTAPRQSPTGSLPEVPTPERQEAPGMLQRAKASEGRIYDRMNESINRTGAANNPEAIAYAIGQTLKEVGQQAARQIRTVGEMSPAYKIAGGAGKLWDVFYRWSKNRYKDAPHTPVEEAVQEFAQTQRPGGLTTPQR
jgi:hypothetical protein